MFLALAGRDVIVLARLYEGRHFDVRLTPGDSYVGGNLYGIRKGVDNRGS